MPKSITLLSLQTFGGTGGIQKMSRTLSHALTEVAARNNWTFKLWSVYDDDTDIMHQYISAKNFKGFGVKRPAFTIKALSLARRSNVVIISHINMAIVGLAIKLIKPKCKVWLVAHGIEVWRPLSGVRKWFLNKCDRIVCVSNFTMHEMISQHKTDARKCIVLNNAIDPFMTIPANFTKPGYLLKRYGINANDAVVFTLTRLAATEQYKGYEQVIKAIHKLRVHTPNIKYILAGQYDEIEEARIKQLIAFYKVENEVILTGFITETELPDHFIMADVFILPSKKEGFGIVFIEALACGLPVICGNVDGSMDAIKNGELGTAVNPDDLMEIEQALKNYLQKPFDINKRKQLQQQCLQYFNESNYINKLEELLLNG